MGVTEVCSHKIVCAKDSECCSCCSGEEGEAEVAGDAGEQTLISIGTDAVKRLRSVITISESMASSKERLHDAIDSHIQYA